VNGFVNRGDVTLAYSVEGSGDKAVLLVMGLGGRAADWGRVFPAALARRYKVVRFDNRGTGGSTKATAGFTLEDMAKDAIAVLDEVGTKRAHLVGISMGGMISQLVALDHPERVDRLVLLSTHFGGGNVVHPTAETASVLAAAPGTAVEEVMRRSLKVITAPGFAEAHPEAIDELVAYAVAAPTPAACFMAQLQAIIDSDRSERVSRIRAPTLVVHGDSDALIPVGNGHRLAEAIPGAKLELLGGCGHLPMWERPEELARIVLEFLGDSALH
jgi:3-oxoadipate enol-lactonase